MSIIRYHKIEWEPEFGVNLPGQGSFSSVPQKDMWKPDYILKPYQTCLLISDSHGSLNLLKSSFDLIPGDISVIFHAGDICEALPVMTVPVCAVKGNCDSFGYDFSVTSSYLPVYKVIEWGGTRILLNHGHEMNVKQTRDSISRLAVIDPFYCNVVFYGHTHHQKIETFEHDGDDCITINPGTFLNGDFLYLRKVDDTLLIRAGKLK